MLLVLKYYTVLLSGMTVSCMTVFEIGFRFGEIDETP
jgi:hypothetical protein